MSTIEGLVDNQVNTDYTVTPCNDGSYCCGNGTVADNCCKENRGLYLSGGKALVREASFSASDINSSSPLEATPSSSSSAALSLHQSFGSLTSIASSVSSSLSRSVSSPSTLISLSAAAKSSNQTGAIVGSAIGAAAAAALITGIVFLVRLRRIKHQQPPERDDFMKSNATHFELAANGPVPELEDSEESRRPLPELEASTRSQ